MTSIIGYIVEQRSRCSGSFLDNHYQWITGHIPPLQDDFIHDLVALDNIRSQCKEWGLQPRYLHQVVRSSKGNLELLPGDPLDWYEFWAQQEAALQLP
jgi:hypothetical protein